MESRHSLIRLTQDYITRIFQDIKNMKALILDAQTMMIISLVISQSQILQRDVFMVQTLDQIVSQSQKLSHLTAVCILRPSQQNISKLCQILSHPKYGGYYLYFTNSISHTHLKTIAQSDRSQVVKQVFQIYSDFYSVNHDLFSFNIPSTISLTLPRTRWDNAAGFILQRMVLGLFSVSLALRVLPVIRFQRSSEICQMVAEELHSKLREDSQLMSSYTARGNRHKTSVDGVDQTTLFLIIDRREDPVTPLLHQWTYQAMLHQLLTISDNRVFLKRVNDQYRDIALSTDQDTFYNQNIYSNFGDLALNIKDYVAQYQQAKQTTGKIDSIEDMKRFIEFYPEFSRMSGNVSKHVTLTSELDHTIKSRLLLDISQLQQDIACNQNRNQHFRSLCGLLQDSRYNPLDKLKLVLLYALRYENDQRIHQLRDMLRNNRVKQEQIELIDAIIEYAGSAVRSCDLFNNKNLLARAKSKMTTVMKNVPNVYTQHVPYLTSIIGSIQKGKLSQGAFPATTQFSQREKVQTVVVFVVGGTTYEEAKEVGLFNQRSTETQIILGGSTIHNSVSFLAEITQLLMRVH